MDGGLVIGIILNKHLHRTFGMPLLPFAYFLSWWSQKGRFASFVINGCSLFWVQGRVLLLLLKKLCGAGSDCTRICCRPVIWLNYLCGLSGFRTTYEATLWPVTGYKHIAGSVLLLGHLTNHLASVPMTFFWLSPVIVAGVSPQFGRWCSFS